MLIENKDEYNKCIVVMHDIKRKRSSLKHFRSLPASITIKQIHIWRDGVALWGHELDVLHKKASQDLFVIWTAHVGSGQAHMRNGSPENAIDDYSNAILIKPYAEIIQQRANAYARLGRFEEAIQDITSAILMDPNSAILYYNRGTAYAKRGSFSEPSLTYQTRYP